MEANDSTAKEIESGTTRIGEKRKRADASSSYLFITVGGTIDKDYPRLTRGYAFEFGEPAFERILSRINPDIVYRIDAPFQKDSTEITAEDRALLLKTISGAEENRIVITHGTDTMIESARYIGQAQSMKGSVLREKIIVLTGAMRPERFANTDAHFNVGCAVGAAAAMPRGTTSLCMNGAVRSWDCVERCHKTGKFVSKDV